MRRIARRIGVDLGVIAVALAVGFGGWALYDNLREDANKYESVPTAADSFAVGEAGDVELPTSPSEPVPAPAGGGAESPAAAVSAFLDAEAAGDFAASWRYVSAADRAVHRSADGWTQAHGVLPTITAFEVVGETPSTVETITSYQPLVDQIRGLVPARAEVAWQVVQEEGRWWVSFGDSAMTPQWPSDDAASDAALAWAAQRKSCDAPEQATTLVGSPAIAEPLCGSVGTLDAGEALALDAVDGALVAATFGELAATETRQVDLSGPVPLRVIVAPFGDRWLVVGVLAPPR